MILENITISVSQKTLNCHELYSSLITIQIPCKVTSNLTITNSFGPENGCEIFIPSINKTNLFNKVWLPLKYKYDFKCAHINIPNKFNGCIIDYCRLKGCENRVDKKEC